MKTLFLSPHTDDAELGCGATISKYQEQGHDVTVIGFSWCGDERLVEEFEFSIGVLDVESILLDFEVREFHKDRQRLLQFLVDYNNTYKPDRVFVPSGQDLHQDHQAVYDEAVRAFKNTSMFGYELPWNHLSFSPQRFEIVDKGHVNKKWMALSQYKTQKDRNYFARDYIEGIARTRGVQVGRTYAEAFDVIREINQ